jgi:hypothetical protein
VFNGNMWGTDCHRLNVVSWSEKLH